MIQQTATAQRFSTLRKLQWSHWFVITAVATVIFGRWLWIMPHGFPIMHPRTLANGPLPALAFAGCLCASIACGRRRPIAVPFTATLPGLGVGLALGCLALYPNSMLTLKVAALSVGLGYLVLAYVAFWWTMGEAIGRGKCISVFCGFLIVGICWAVTQRAALPSTLPLNISPPDDPGITRDAQPEPIVFRNSPSTLYVYPFLEFRSLSPDRFWTLFAPKLSDSWVPATTYWVDRRVENAVTTWCQLESDNYSHLNTFTELEFVTHGAISVSFSPCPDQRIAVRRSDYPYGEPARFAYLGADDISRIAEAASGEKGPFTELASAQCSPNHLLEVTLYSDDKPAFVLRFDDFLPQCSRDLSPTAGWGVPQNSIQFSLGVDAPETAFFFFTLASTSVGCGFDSVGHQRGIYRNQMTVTLPQESSR
ncbi:MAG: hypothetical protein O3C21_02535 [Verrucomicrobia bacterium]|nr:hypothetical protein [Verrucomicrobiota bacterium]